MRAYQHPRMWEPDRLHMSHHGHRFLARAVLASLGHVDPSITLRELGSIDPTNWRRAVASEREWWSEWLTPMLARRMRNERVGEHLMAKWPDLFHPSDGMKKQAQRRLDTVRGFADKPRRRD